MIQSNEYANIRRKMIDDLKEVITINKENLISCLISYSKS